MIAQVVTNIHLFDFTVFVLALNEYVFKKVVIMLLHLLIADVGHH